MNYLSFTAEEIEAIQRAIRTAVLYPGFNELQTLDLRQVADTGGFYQKNALRDLLANAIDLELETTLGGNRFMMEHYEPLRLAALKIYNIPPAKALNYLAACSHPPTGVLLRPWLLTAKQLAAVWEVGLKTLVANTKTKHKK